MNPPAVKGIIESVNFKKESLNINVRVAPNTEVKAMEKFKIKALVREKSAWIRTPKSPISCGISWAITAMVVAKPIGKETMYEPAIIKPSKKLWNPSPTRFMIPTGCGCLCEVGIWQCLQHMIFSKMKKKIMPSKTVIQVNRLSFFVVASGSKCIKTSPNNVPADKLTR